MGRPLGLLRAGYPYLKTLGMRRVTDYPYDLAFGPDDKLYVLCRTSGRALIRVWTFDDAERLTDDLVQIGDYGSNDGQFQWPVQIITDCDGNLYVSDEATHKVSKFNPDGKFESRWGNEGSGKGEFTAPTGISFDQEGNMVVADSGNSRIQTYDASGKLVQQFGESGEAEGQLKNPWGIHVDEFGDVYVADWGNNRVQVFSNDGDVKMVLEGKTPDGVAINRPSSVTVDQHGDIYITDWTNNRVLVYDSNGRYVWRFLGDATLSRVARDYMMTNAYANRLREMANLEEEKYFRNPTSVRVDNQFRICVADHSSYRLQVYQKESVELDENSIAPPMRNHSLTTV